MIGVFSKRALTTVPMRWHLWKLVWLAGIVAVAGLMGVTIKIGWQQGWLYGLVLSYFWGLALIVGGLVVSRFKVVLAGRLPASAWALDDEERGMIIMVPMLKVYGYVTRQHDGRQELLIFSQDDPAAGWQVPGGTVDPGETLVAAVQREVAEESGLHDLELQGEVAVTIWENPDEQSKPYERHFFHFLAPEAPETFEHVVTGDGTDAGMTFSYRWLDVAEGGTLAAGMGQFLGYLAKMEA